MVRYSVLRRMNGSFRPRPSDASPDKRVRRSSALLAAAIPGYLALCSCVSSRVHSAIPAFATALTSTTTNVQTAFETVEQKYEEAQALELAVNYDTAGFDPDKVNPWLQPEDMEARTKLLKALQQYASQLESIAGKDSMDEADTTTKALGASLTEISKSEPVKKMAGEASMASNAATSAIDNIARWLMESKRSKELPNLIQQMQEPIETICTLLRKDIGERTKGSHGSGLRDQLWLDYSQLIMEQDSFIQHNKDKLTPIEKRTEIERLPALVRERKESDETLAQTSDCLKQVVKANAELLKAVQTKQDLRSEINDLFQEASRINDFAHSLNTPSK